VRREHTHFAFGTLLRFNVQQDHVATRHNVRQFSACYCVAFADFMANICWKLATPGATVLDFGT
jgi:hypothetical protein